MRALLSPGIGCILLALGVAHAQLQEFCSVEKVDVQKLSNAIVIKLQCDGLVQLEPVIWTMKSTDSEDEFNLRETDQISFRLTNAVSGSASMVNIAQYPVSHLAFEMDPGSEENIGIRCTLKLYKPGWVFVFTRRKREYSRWFNRPDRGEEWDWTPFREYFEDYFNGKPWLAIQTSEDQKQIIITVQTGRPEEPAPVRPPIQEAPPSLQLAGNAQALNLRAVHTNLDSLLQRLADETGIPIFLDDRVQCRVTAHMTDVPLRRLLQVLASSYGLNLREEDGAYYLTLSRPDNPASYWAATSRTVPLYHLSPSRALLMLPDVVLPYVHPSRDGNALVVDGPAAMVERVERDLRTLDQPTRLCRLRCWVVTAENTDDELREVMSRVSGGDTDLRLASDGQLSITIGAERGTRTLARLRALQRRGRLRIETLPSVLCWPGASANLFVGQSIYYLRVYGDYGEITLDKVSVGTSLDVWTRNVGDTITARVNVANSVTGEQTAEGPTIFTQRAQSTLRIRSGDLMVVGGLRSSEHGEDDQEPLPALGPLSNVISGRFRQNINGEVTVLVQAESLASAPLAEGYEGVR